MDKLLRIASILDKSGHYELSDELFKIAQQQSFLSNVKNFVSDKFKNVQNFVSDRYSKDPLNSTQMLSAVSPLGAVGQYVDKNKPQVEQIQQQVVSNPILQDIIKNAPAELAKEIYKYGLEKFESNEGLQGFINLVSTKYGPKFDDILTKLRSPSLRSMKRMPPVIGKNGALKVYTMGNNQAFESFLQTTSKLSPTAKSALRSLMQSTGKNLQNISKSLEGFAGSPQAQLIEPAIEIAFNEFGKYIENPQAYKSSMSVNTKEVEKSLNPYIAWQELVLSYKAKYQTPQAVLAAFKKNNPTISIQVPNFAQGQVFNQPLSMGSQSSRPFNQLDPSVQQNIIYMINNNGALPPSSTTPIMSPGESNKLRNQQ